MILQRRSDGACTGVGLPSEAGNLHPGLAGHQPHIVLLGGFLTLRRRDSWWRRLRTRAYRRWGRPAALITIDLGSAIEQVAEDDDVLKVMRSGSGVYGAILRRGPALLMAVGDVTGRLEGEITIAEDPRIDDDRMYVIKAQLQRPETTFAWLDSEDPNFDDRLQRLADQSGESRVIAYRARSFEERVELNYRIADATRCVTGGIDFVSVAPHFTTAESGSSTCAHFPTGARQTCIFNLRCHKVTWSDCVSDSTRFKVGGTVTFTRSVGWASPESHHTSRSRASIPA